MAIKSGRCWVYDRELDGGTMNDSARCTSNGGIYYTDPDDYTVNNCVAVKMLVEELYLSRRTIMRLIDKCGYKTYRIGGLLSISEGNAARLNRHVGTPSLRLGTPGSEFFVY
jgi:hypothetical protein